jgi:hypothetical protein
MCDLRPRLRHQIRGVRPDHPYTDEEYIADVLTQDAADDTENFDLLFTPQVVAELEQISAAARAGGKTYTSEEVREHFRKKSDAWRASHPE